MCCHHYSAHRAPGPQLQLWTSTQSLRASASRGKSQSISGALICLTRGKSERAEAEKRGEERRAEQSRRKKGKGEERLYI